MYTSRRQWLISRDIIITRMSRTEDGKTLSRSSHRFEFGCASEVYFFAPFYYKQRILSWNIQAQNGENLSKHLEHSLIIRQTGISFAAHAYTRQQATQRQRRRCVYFLHNLRRSTRYTESYTVRGWRWRSRRNYTRQVEQEHWIRFEYVCTARIYIYICI